MDNKEGQDAATIEDLKDERVPSCLTWSYEEVADWIEELGFPYYRVGEAFFPCQGVFFTLSSRVQH